MKSAKGSVRHSATVAAILLAAVLVLTGCEWNSLVDKGTSGSIPVIAKPEDNTTLDTTAPGTEAPVIKAYHPLTGMPCEEALETLRPISVCIGNSASATLYSIGLSMADILVEAPVEDGSRLMMIFNDAENVKRIGSVRSTRSWLMSVSDSFGAVAVYNGTTDIAGGQESVFPGGMTIDYLQNTASDIFIKDASLAPPNHILTSGPKIAAALQSSSWGATTTSIPLPYRLAPEGGRIALSGDTALTVRTVFSATQTCEFKYNALTEEYQRYQNGKPQTDALNSKQLAFTNLLFLMCNVSSYTSASGTSFSLDMASGGSGYYMTGGKCVSIRWSLNAEGLIQCTDATGEVLTVSSGTTYIGLIKVGEAATFSYQ